MAFIKVVNISLEIFGALLSFVIICSMLISDNTKDKCHRCFLGILVCNIILLLSDAAAWGFKGQLDTCSRIIVPVANFLVFTLGYIIMLLYSHYLYWYLKKKTNITKSVLVFTRIFVAVAIIMTIVSLVNHMFYYIDADNMYRRGSYFWLSQTLAIICMLGNGVILVYYHRVLNRIEFLFLSAQIILPIIAMAIQIKMYGIALLYIATTYSILNVYLNIQGQMARHMKEREVELLNSRIAIMLSMIQPHFLYNSLTAVSRLCDTDPGKAKQGIQSISVYLRENLNSLSNEAFITFEREFEHIKIYLSLEKMRFEENLDIVYDIQIYDFMIPPLLLEPIVENAVRHGIARKQDKGTVRIMTQLQGEEILLAVEDDGVGFDTAIREHLDYTHIGLKNVESRCRLLCNGRMELESEQGTGTKVMIYLPTSLLIDNKISGKG